jgi:hypothetical protein
MSDSALSKRGGAFRAQVPSVRGGAFKSHDLKALEEDMAGYIKQVGVLEALNFRTYEHTPREKAANGNDLAALHLFSSVIIDHIPSASMHYQDLKAMFVSLVQQFPLMNGTQASPKDWGGLRAQKTLVILHHWRRLRRSEVRWRQASSKCDSLAIKVMQGVLKKIVDEEDAHQTSRALKKELTLDENGFPAMLGGTVPCEDVEPVKKKAKKSAPPWGVFSGVMDYPTLYSKAQNAHPVPPKAIERNIANKEGKAATKEAKKEARKAAKQAKTEVREAEKEARKADKSSMTYVQARQAAKVRKAAEKAAKATPKAKVRKAAEKAAQATPKAKVRKAAEKAAQATPKASVKDNIKIPKSLHSSPEELERDDITTRSAMSKSFGLMKLTTAQEKTYFVDENTELILNIMGSFSKYHRWLAVQLFKLAQKEGVTKQDLLLWRNEWVCRHSARS